VGSLEIELPFGLEILVHLLFTYLLSEVFSFLFKHVHSWRSALFVVVPDKIKRAFVISGKIVFHVTVFIAGLEWWGEVKMRTQKGNYIFTCYVKFSKLY